MSRKPELDGIRGVAILLVLIWHYLVGRYFIKYDILPEFLIQILSITWSGVDLFFVLSGFLIAGILIDQKESENYYKVFFVRRICRIFPLYYSLLIIFFLLQFSQILQWPSLFNRTLPIWSYATFTQNFLMGLDGNFGNPSLSITWSLAVEEQFYLFLPFLIRYIKKNHLPLLFISLALMAPIFRLMILPSLGAFIFSPCRMDSIFVGALLAYGVRNEGIVSFFSENLKMVYGLLFVLFGGVVGLSLKTPYTGEVFIHLWLAGFYGILILIVLIHKDSFLTRIFSNSLLKWIGVRSYGIYLFHLLFIGIVYRLPGIQPFRELPLIFSALFLTLTFSAFSYKFFECPIIDLGHRLTYKKGKERDKKEGTN